MKWVRFWFWAFRLRLVRYCWQHDDLHWFRLRACKHRYIVLNDEQRQALRDWIDGKDRADG